MKKAALIALALCVHLTASAQSQDSLMPWKRYEYVGDYISEGLREVGCNGTFGIVNTQWKEIAPCIYDGSIWFDEGYATVSRYGKEGLLDTLGNEVIPCIYDKVYHYSNDISQRGPGFQVIKDGKHGIVGHHGNIMVPIIYDELETISDTRIIASLGRARGLIDFQNTQILPFRFWVIEPDYSSAIYVTRDSLRQWAAFDSSGKLIADGYDKMEHYNEWIILIKCQGKWGVIDSRGKIILPTIYDSIDHFLQHNSIALKKDGKWGLADERGSVIVPCVYDKIKYINTGIYAAKNNGIWKIYSDSGAYELQAEYDDIGLNYGSNRIWVKRSGRYGYINLHGKEIFPCSLDYPSQDEATFNLSNARNQTLNNATNPVKPTHYEYAGIFSGGRAKVKDNVGHYGFINKKGKTIIPSIYEEAEDFHYGLAAAKKNGHYGYIDTMGRIVVDFIYDEAENFYEGLAAVAKEGKYGYINSSGKMVIPLIYKHAERFYHGKANVVIDNAWGMIDKKGKVVIPFLYEQPFWFIDGLARVSFNGQMFFIDSTGATAIADSSEFYSPFSDGMAITGNDTGYGYINTSGKLVIPYIYDERPTLFAHSLASVKYTVHTQYGNTERYTVINKQGKSVLPGEYTFISNFTDDGTAVISQFGDLAVINSSLKIITPFIYQDIGPNYSAGLLAVKRNDKWGYIDHNGRTIIPHKYTKAGQFSEGLAPVMLNDEWGYIDRSGKEVMWLRILQ